MSKIVLVRHGCYNASTGELDAEGMSQIKRLADSLRDHVATPCLIASSHVLRCKQTAEVLARHMCMASSIEGWAELTHEYSITTEGLDQIYSRVCKARQLGNLVLVTHQPVVEDYAQFCLHRWGRPVEALTVWFGEAVLIDEDLKEFHVIRQI